VSRATACVVTALVAAASCAVDAEARAQNAGKIGAPERVGLVIVGTTRPARVEVVTVGAGPARAEMDRAVRDVVGALPELTWTDGDAGAGDRASQVLIDVTDRVRVRIVAKGAPSVTEPAASAPPPVVREVVIAGLSPDVARETVAQIVQTTVRAMLDPAGAHLARALALQPPPIAPSDPSQPAVTAERKAPPVFEPRLAHDGVVGGLISFSRHTFPFDTDAPLTQYPFDGLALSFSRRFPVLVVTARLSGQLNEQTSEGFKLGTQALMASVGAGAHLDRGDLSFALGLEAGAIVIHEKLDFHSNQSNVSYDLGGGFDSNWWSGPLVALRGAVDYHLSSRAFLRVEPGLTVVAVEPKHSGATHWQVYQYGQLMLGAGYSF
jgi:hypothetical protein